MVNIPLDIQQSLQRILPKVQKPGRYSGGEFNQILKDWAKIPLRVCLVFPDIYDIGMSNLGLAILYDLINQREDALAERAFAPWLDMEEQIRQANLPLYALESKHPLRDFDIIGFTLPYESLFTNALNILDLAQIPLFSSQRTSRHPLIIAGGHATFNPEPMHAFIDAFVIGEGEEVIHEVLDVYASWKKNNPYLLNDDNDAQTIPARKELLRRLAQLEGVYVPTFYQATYNLDQTFSHLVCSEPSAPAVIRKRIVAKLPPPPEKFIVPYIETIHDRIPIEIMRGCTRGCRFCQAGMVTRPVRERSVGEIIKAIEESLKNTGYEEVGLLSLSSSDYTNIIELISTINSHFSTDYLSVSLPSLRIESLSVELMNILGLARRNGFTLAPEAATERMRRIINKPVSTEQLLETVDAIYRNGWSTIKLYFMIGHPLETLEDVQAIADLSKMVLHVGRKHIGHRAQVNVGVSTFIPKPHTPFQWTVCDSEEQILSKLELLKEKLRVKGIKLTWNPPDATFLEAWLSRGDRRMSAVIYQAWKLGAKFDAWNDQRNLSAWLQAFEDNQIDPHFYTHRERSLEEAFPWDHIDIGVRKNYLLEDYKWSLAEKTRPDCRTQCYACGILPKYNQLRQNNPGDGWKCPEVKPKIQESLIEHDAVTN